MDDLDPFTFQGRAPTANRPLVGSTVLVVEDSKFASEALRLLCLRSGARIRRADCLRSARRHLQVYRPTIAMIDIGLQDGSGIDLIAELCSTTPRIPVVIGMSGDPEHESAVLSKGAESFMPKPVTSLAAFQELLLRHMPADRQPPGPRLVRDDRISPDPIAYHDDLAHMADVLNAASDDNTMDYVTQFLSGVARSAADADMIEVIEELSARRAIGRPCNAQMTRLAGLVQSRLEQSMAV